MRISVGSYQCMCVFFGKEAFTLEIPNGQTQRLHFHDRNGNYVDDDDDDDLRHQATSLFKEGIYLIFLKCE